MCVASDGHVVFKQEVNQYAVTMAGELEQADRAAEGLDERLNAKLCKLAIASLARCKHSLH
jgi:hypothetical protein